MCGIVGIYSYAGAAPPVDRGELVRIRDHMTRRGPDGAGTWMSGDGRLGLGHRRLAIIDLSDSGAQPMLSADGRYVITFNGEIYNHVALRRELEAEGAVFRSQSDTEVLLQLYARRGERMLSALRGMFAFGIWDNLERRLFLARDPYGIKPLYYADDGATLRFASQVKALMAGGAIDTTPAPAGIVGFMLLGSVPEPHTTVRAVRSLPAGATLTIGPAGCGDPRVYFDIRQTLLAAQDQPADPAQLPTLLREAVRDSVARHMIADVPVGVFLSAGIDSGAIASLASESVGAGLRALTLGFDEYRNGPDDEIPLAAAVARQCGAAHQVEWITRDDFFRELPNILDAMDQPTIDGVNTYLLSRAAAGAGMKVALSGLGGDELFGGYPSFTQIPKLVRSVGWAPHWHSLGRTVRKLAGPIISRLTSPKYSGLLEYGGSFGGAYLLRRGLFMPWELDALLDPRVLEQGLEELELVARLEATTAGLRGAHPRIVALESSWYMRNQLLRDADWAGMAHSLEIRVPLVDAQLLQTLAPHICAPGAPGKKSLLGTPTRPLPCALGQRAKTGFTTPIRAWIDSESAPQRRGLRGWAVRVADLPARETEAWPAGGGFVRRTVLVYRIGQLGDTLIAIPAIRAIRLRHRGDRLVLLTDRQADSKGWVSSWDVLGPLGLFDEVVFYRPAVGPGGLLRTLATIAPELRRLKADVVYNLAPERSAWQRERDQLFFTGVVGTRAYVAPRYRRRKLTHQRDGHLAPGQPEWRRLLDLVETNTLTAEPDRISTGAHAPQARRILRDAGGVPGHPTIAIGPGSKMSSKRWAEASFAAVIAALAVRHPDHQFVILGDQKDAEIGARLAASLPGRCINLAGRLTILESGAILQDAQVYLGNDTGTMHLAAAVGCPCVAIFSARDRPGRWDPIGFGHVVLRRSPSCAGCLLEVCTEFGNACLTGISPDEVVEAAGRILARRSATRVVDRLPVRVVAAPAAAD